MKRITLFFTLLGLFAGTIQAHNDDHDSRDDKRRVDPPQREIWVEGPVAYPAYPQEENLLEYRLPNKKPNHRYLLDTESINVGDDGVVRYSIAIDSGSGGRRVVFEGIHCKTRRYSPYAYGVRGEQFQRRKKLIWTPIRNIQSSKSYRHYLAEDLLCSGDGSPNTKEQIQQKLAGQVSSN